MILYLDTSSLAKLYVEEPHSEAVREWVSEAEVVATCRIAYPEMLSALNRRFRSGDLSEEGFRRLVDTFSKEWEDLLVVDFGEREAGKLATRHALRALDAIHFSAFQRIKKACQGIACVFSSFDKRLTDVVFQEGYPVLLPEEG